MLKLQGSTWLYDFRAWGIKDVQLRATVHEGSGFEASSVDRFFGFWVYSSRK